MASDYSNHLLKNVHLGLSQPANGESFFVTSEYEYWHYGCDGVNDRGWGCGYRTLQTIISWIIKNLETARPVPSLREVQEILISLEDKESFFLGSRDWIGSFEVCLVIDQRYGVPSKIIHVPSGKDLKKYSDAIKQHFIEFGSPIMMGGDRDCSSKGIMGIHYSAKEISLLIVDPHFVGKAKNAEQLANDGWVKWQSLTDFVDSSFYNLCLPQIKHKSFSE
ncbi:ufm1-specific protease 1 isoform X1 [Neodiprion virginianus]|uniref:ufm1-specific protease 1 isoform X1 n=1 Tax=Neodiprion virginianus TaxID=2961670 RepID=UPI001EE6F863|nr:ufm1-specific protease 1 isoform X1 [Neodiprion virginianus]